MSRYAPSAMAALLSAVLGCSGATAIDDAGMDAALPPVDGGIDAGRPDASLRDGGVPDAPEDAAAALDATMQDATPPADAAAPRQLACDSCDTDEDCVSGHVCSFILGGARACLPTCTFSYECPRGLGRCEAGACHQTGSWCCADFDGDGFGRGEHCLTAENECDDSDPDVHRYAPEVCNGRDDDCDGVVDSPATTCERGTCVDLPDRSEATPPGTCSAGVCDAPVPVDCGPYRCGTDGCGTTCADPFLGGVDRDDLCTPAARCDSGACLPDLANGETCDEDSDCVSGFCPYPCPAGPGTCVCETRSGS